MNNTLCILDILTIISNDKDSFYVPNEDFFKETKKHGLFVKDDDILSRGKFSNITIAKNKFNINIGYKVYGNVMLGEKAKELGINEKYPSFLHRTQTIIKNGKLIVEVICVVISDVTLSILKRIFKKYSFDDKIKVIQSKENSHMVLINLKEIPMWNETYLELVTVEELGKLTEEITKLQAMQSVYNYYIGDLKSKEKFLLFEGMNTEQTRYLLDIGIKYDGSYGTINEEEEKEKTSTAYEYEVNIKGMASIPTIATLVNSPDGLLKKDNIMYNAINDTYGHLLLNKPNLKTAEEELYVIKTNLRKKRFEFGKIFFPSIINSFGFYFTGAKDQDNLFFHYNGNTINIKRKEIKVGV